MKKSKNISDILEKLNEALYNNIIMSDEQIGVILSNTRKDITYLIQTFPINCDRVTEKLECEDIMAWIKSVII